MSSAESVRDPNIYHHRALSDHSDGAAKLTNRAYALTRLANLKNNATSPYRPNNNINIHRLLEAREDELNRQSRRRQNQPHPRRRFDPRRWIGPVYHHTIGPVIHRDIIPRIREHGGGLLGRTALAGASLYALRHGVPFLYDAASAVPGYVQNAHGWWQRQRISRQTRDPWAK